MTDETPLALYVGETTHCRFEPRRHSFRYRLFQILVDVDRLGDAFAGLTLLRQGRTGLFSFAARDHGARDGAPLRPWVVAKLTEAEIPATAARIRLLCFPRVLGFVFNPISIFFVEDAEGRLEAVIYEVNNTFGQTHAYVVPAAGHAIERQEADKVFYVSPFYRVEGGYRFRVTPPGEAFSLAIEKHTAGQADFTATLDLKRRAISNFRLALLFLGMPLMTLGVVFAIHWQALRLWLKGAPFGARPPGPKVGISVGRATRPVS
jgi:DUF1365 family protein